MIWIQMKLQIFIMKMDCLDRTTEQIFGDIWGFWQDVCTVWIRITWFVWRVRASYHWVPTMLLLLMMKMMMVADQDKLRCHPLCFSFYLFWDAFHSSYFLWQKMVLLCAEVFSFSSSLKFSCSTPHPLFFSFYHRQKCGETISLLCECWESRWCCIDTILEWFYSDFVCIKVGEWNCLICEPTVW